MEERQANGRSSIEARAGIGCFLLVWLAGAVAQVVTLAAFGSTDGEVPIGVLGATLIAGWSVSLVGVWLASQHIGSGDVGNDIGIRFAPIDVIGIPIGIGAQLLLVPAVYLPLRAVWPETFSDSRLSETAEDLVERAQASSNLTVALLCALVIIGAPVVEEVLYRGLLQRPLLDRFGAPLVVIGVAAVFAFIHFRPVEYPGLFAAGLVFGVCAWRTSRLGMAIAAHIGFNAVGIALAL